MRVRNNSTAATLEAQERTLGTEHPDTLTSVNNLGILLRKKGDARSAVTIVRDWVDKCLTRPTTLLYNYACFECQLGHVDQARQLIAEYLEKHPNMADEALKDPDLEPIRGWLLRTINESH